jgi:hypothetical protein
MALSQIDLTGYPQTGCIHFAWWMGDGGRCWHGVVLSALVWMGVMVVNDPIVASTIFGIVLGYL